MNRSTLGFAATALLTMTVHTGFAAEPAANPAMHQAAASTNLIARADHALRDYVAACSTGDEEAIARIVTSDAVVEYALDEPGTYLAVEAAALGASRSGKPKQTGPAAHISNLSIFPTNDQLERGRRHSLDARGTRGHTCDRFVPRQRARLGGSTRFVGSLY
jgi:hypothetical protein